jgi:hypothetical protein
MEYLFWFGFALISLAAGDYLLRRYRDSQRLRKQQKEVDAILNPPEALIARQLGDAKRSMFPEDYVKFEKSVYALIEETNNRIAKR